MLMSGFVSEISEGDWKFAGRITRNHIQSNGEALRRDGLCVMWPINGQKRSPWWVRHVFTEMWIDWCFVIVGENVCWLSFEGRRQADNYFVGSRKHEIRMVMSSLQANSRNVLELLINLVLGLRLAFQVMTALSGCQGWLVNTMHKDPNRGASFIAESVINMGPPQWLRSFFDNEEGFL